MIIPNRPQGVIVARAYIPSPCLPWSRFCPDRGHFGPSLGDIDPYRDYGDDLGLYRDPAYRDHGFLVLYRDRTCHPYQAKVAGARILQQI